MVWFALMEAIVAAWSARMQQARDDNVMMNLILSTHSPVDREYHVQPLFLIIEDVMHRAKAPLLGTILSTTLQIQCNILILRKLYFHV